MRIYEPTPFSPEYYSHKINNAGLRYKIGLSFGSGEIVWVHAPFTCGSFSDVRIFRIGMKRKLLRGEYVVAHGGYTDENCKTVTTTPSMTRLFSVARARHETVNGRLKTFLVLQSSFRPNISLHSLAFMRV